MVKKPLWFTPEIAAKAAAISHYFECAGTAMRIDYEPKFEGFVTYKFLMDGVGQHALLDIDGQTLSDWDTENVIRKLEAGFWRTRTAAVPGMVQKLGPEGWTSRKVA